MEEDIVRVLRVIEYEGPRSWVEEMVRKSIHGEKRLNSMREVHKIIRAATIGDYPQILKQDGEIIEDDPLL